MEDGTIVLNFVCLKADSRLLLIEELLGSEYLLLYNSVSNSIFLQKLNLIFILYYLQLLIL
jgi:hypothetical protein